jgi:hypothetical protein
VSLTVINCTPQPGPSRFERRYGHDPFNGPDLRRLYGARLLVGESSQAQEQSVVPFPAPPSWQRFREIDWPQEQPYPVQSGVDIPRAQTVGADGSSPNSRSDASASIPAHIAGQTVPQSLPRCASSFQPSENVHLGTFEGLRNSHLDDEESECLVKTFLSLFAIVAALSALAAFTWGL